MAPQNSERKTLNLDAEIEKKSEIWMPKSKRLGPAYRWVRLIGLLRWNRIRKWCRREKPERERDRKVSAHCWGETRDIVEAAKVIHVASDKIFC